MLEKLRYKLKNLKYRLALRDVPRPKWDAQAPSAKFYHSQFGQDQFVAERLSFKRQGVFVDIGANDGITLSNSYFFEKELDWTGIAVEPLGTIFEKLSEVRDCHLFNGCVSDIDGQVDFMNCDVHNGMLSGIVSKLHSKHIESVDRANLLQGGTQTTEQTSSVTPARLFAKHGIDEIDYLSIDTEGGELDILRSCDFRSVHVRLISVENNHYDLTILDHMRQQGFRLIARLGVDEIYENTALRQVATIRQAA